MDSPKRLEFEITNGQGLVYLAALDEVSYLFVEQPRAVAWPGHSGTYTVMLAQLGYSKSEALEMATEFRERLYDDYTFDLEGLKALLSPLFRLFENGRYSLSFNNSDDDRRFHYISANDLPGIYYKANWRLAFSRHAVGTEEDGRAWHKAYSKECADKGYMRPSLFEATTDECYEGMDTLLLCVQATS